MSPRRLLPSSESSPRLTRRGLLGAAAGVGLAGLASGAPTSASAEPAALQVTKIKNLTGPEITGHFGIPWTDLGIPARCPDGRTFYVFGDTFAPNFGDNRRSPVGLWSSSTDLAAGVTFDGTPGGDFAAQLVQHGPDISTVIPSDVITLGDTMYLHAVANAGFGNGVWSGIWTSTDNGASWHDSGARFPADAYGGMWQLATWELGDDGWIYMFTSKFLRSTPMILHRVRPESITDVTAYEPWGWDGSAWGWGNPATTVTDGRYGEACLRRLGDRWLLTWFDPENYRIDAQVIDHPTANIRTAPRTTLLFGGDWGTEQPVNYVPQLYGSYVLPGSTLDDLHLTVSQWRTGDNSVYHSTQYRFQGFGALHA
ncbi:DUF4185 domain-containing protein [Propionibacteriaceae bacterium Y1685]